jgi:phospholipid/cholesterol/gamma-HCH transport system substrate-binding protein
MTPNRERVWVGLFVIVATVVFAVTAIAVWGGFGASGAPHRAYFKFSGGVQAGTPVRYGGMRVGSVRQVGIDPSDSTRIEVRFVVDPGTPLKTDSVAKVATLGPLSDSYIEITTGSATAALLPPDSVINSTESLGFAQLGDVIQELIPRINEALEKLTMNLDQMQVTLARADDVMSDANRANLRQALARLNDVLNDGNRANVTESLANLNRMLNDSRPAVASVLTGLNEANAKLHPLLEDIRKTSTHADDVLAHIDAVVSENRQDLRASVSELREMLTSSSDAVDQLRSLMNQNAANVYEILENMRSSSVNMRNLTETIRSNPSTLIRGINVRDRKPGEIGQ